MASIKSLQDCLPEEILKKKDRFLMKQSQLLRSLPIELVLLTLPYHDPGNEVYHRESDKAILSIQSGYNSAERKLYGIPYGSYARLLLYFICSEVKRTNDKKIHLGKNIQQILENIGVTKEGVRNNGKVYELFKDQILRLTNANIQVVRKDFSKEKNDTKITQETVRVAKSIKFWKTSTDLDYEIVVTDDFFNYVQSNSSTIFDAKILFELKSSPMLLDLYIFLNYKAFVADKYNKDIVVTFEELYQNFGSKSSKRKFKQNIKKHLIKLAGIHLELKIQFLESGEGFIIRKDSCSNVQPSLF